MLPGEGVIHMDNQTKESSICLLKQLRDAYQGQLDTSVIEEIEAVISALEQDGTRSKSLAALDWGDRVLELIGKVIRLVTNITDLMS
jgi:hypothetical protein